MGNQGLVIGPLSPGGGHLGARRDQRRLQRFDVVWQGLGTGIHDAGLEHKISRLRRPRGGASQKVAGLSGRLRAPTVLRVSPVDRFQQIAHLAHR